ncbi:hypothetical protein GGF31_003260 [Allomyces arbusculus]|nr:hypothetical protein GGF31_003260 [Allomyces arbusculus]
MGRLQELDLSVNWLSDDEFEWIAKLPLSLKRIALNGNRHVDSVVKITHDETMDEATDLTQVKMTTPMKKKSGKKQSRQLEKAMARGHIDTA